MKMEGVSCPGYVCNNYVECDRRSFVQRFVYRQIKHFVLVLRFVMFNFTVCLFLFFFLIIFHLVFVSTDPHSVFENVLKVTTFWLK